MSIEDNNSFIRRLFDDFKQPGDSGNDSIEDTYLTRIHEQIRLSGEQSASLEALQNAFSALRNKSVSILSDEEKLNIYKVFAESLLSSEVSSGAISPITREQALDLVSRAYGITEDTVRSFNQDIRRIRPALCQSFPALQLEANQQNVKDTLVQYYESKIETQPVVITIPKEDEVEGYTDYNIPDVFIEDNLEQQRFHGVAISIGGAKDVEGNSREDAETMIRNADLLSARLCKDPSLRQELFSKILACCSQRLPIAVGSIKGLLNMACANLLRDHAYDLDMGMSSIQIGSAKGLLGGVKDNTVKVSYHFQFDMKPALEMRDGVLSEEETAKLDIAKQALGLGPFLTLTLDGSFELEVDKSIFGKKISTKISEVKSRATLH